MLGGAPSVSGAKASGENTYIPRYATSFITTHALFSKATWGVRPPTTGINGSPLRYQCTACTSPLNSNFARPGAVPANADKARPQALPDVSPARGVTSIVTAGAKRLPTYS